METQNYVAPEHVRSDPSFAPYLDAGDHRHLDHVFARMQQPNLDILELGTRRVGPVPTVRRSKAHPSSRYIASDFMEGLDVDVVADAHQLSKTFSEGSFDIVIAFSVYEHIARPWIATNEIAKILKPGGWFFAQTHQSFPLHGYPHDYFRFSREALELLCNDAGLKVLGSFHAFPTKIVTPHSPPLADFPAYLNSNILAEKP